MGRWSKRALEGELYIENRHAPAFPPEELATIEKNLGFRLPGARHSGPKPYEKAILRCCHCGTFIIKNPWRSRPRGYCAKCDAYRCDRPTCVLTCTPIERRYVQVARANEARARGQSVTLT